MPAAPPQGIRRSASAPLTVTAGAVVAVALSASQPRTLYLKAKTWIDRAAGAVMAGLGVRLIVEGVRARG